MRRSSAARRLRWASSTPERPGSPPSDSQGFWEFAWLGSTVIYTTGPSKQSLTLTALSNAGTVSTELARNVSAYASAAIPAPTRLLYSRAASGPDGPAGLWVVDLPR